MSIGIGVWVNGQLPPFDARVYQAGCATCGWVSHPFWERSHAEAAGNEHLRLVHAAAYRGA